MNSYKEIFYDSLSKTKYHDFEGETERDLEVDFKQKSTTFKNCSEIEIVDYLLKDKSKKEKQLEELTQKVETLLNNQNNHSGFLSISSSISDIWDNEVDDDWANSL